jgi:hypothetical protein
MPDLGTSGDSGRGKAARAILLGALAVLATATAVAAGDSGRSHARATAPKTGRELAVTGAIRRELRAAAVAYHRSGRVNGPLLDSVRLARYGGSDWAIATFTAPGLGLASQPELLRRPTGRSWGDLGPVGPSLCGVPKPVLAAWELTRRARACTAPLRGGAPPPVGD